MACASSPPPMGANPMYFHRVFSKAPTTTVPTDGCGAHLLRFAFGRTSTTAASTAGRVTQTLRFTIDKAQPSLMSSQPPARPSLQTDGHDVRDFSQPTARPSLHRGS
ncbi:hypothetical protein GN244_ATG04133 [Phytophthora infestans]|uniref:Uncharacterized protein n=1 Tax=Phytophthora infestans TaxID=4787 RepID=A0A833TN51_PHYIN|nr:hypothetical protein GN244_ATG04133 [Phytophthora infestans]